MGKKYVYFFGQGNADGGAHMKNTLGGKGANLAEMTSLGIPVPAGFTLTTDVCTYYYKNDHKYPKELQGQVVRALKKVEKVMGAKFGDPKKPLLLSVRSGARVSMPGMMDTVLNLGLNERTIQGLIDETNNPRFAYDSYRRFIQMYGDVVLDLKPESKDDVDPFEEIIEKKKKEKKVELDLDLDVEDLKDLIGRFKAAVMKRTKQKFPDDPMEQLWGAIGAVFGSWNNERAIAYRELNNIPEEWGTAVNVQAMVFGNMGESSGTGVCFTRDPATGEDRLYGEYLMNAQGEDVVAGIRTPLPVDNMAEENSKIYKQLVRYNKKLEKHYKDMQDTEFTIQKGKLWMLQTRAGKRTGFAAIRIAVDMVDQGLISKKEAIRRIEPEQLNQFLRPIFHVKEKQQAEKSGRLLAKGLNAGPGAASGRVVFNAEDAQAWAGRGEKVILVRIETSPEDIRGMNAAEGILTARGGMTSHAALVARQMGKVCVAGCGALDIDYKKRRIMVNGMVLKEGDYMSLDGTLGEVFGGEIETIPSEVLQVLISKKLKPEKSTLYQQYEKLMQWADQIRRLGIRTNSDQPDQAAQAIAFGAEGIGLCRTEHMFFGEGKIDAVREMILASDEKGRKKALRKLLPYQKRDFKGIFKVMNGLPVTIRTLDPPLHEFLPHHKKEIQSLAKQMKVTPAGLKRKIEMLKEANPMLGHRGCRLGISYPEITEMQARAIFEAACELAKKNIRVLPEVMIPLVGHVNEFARQKAVVTQTAEEVFKKYGIRVDYKVGTMIELPRAAVTADEIAREAEFFSFGTNDLTQTVFGLSRDDAGRFLPDYISSGILEHDPFVAIDQGGVGELVRLGVEKGRAAKSGLKIGICGEHGGEPISIDFCHRIGLDYVSRSPFRVPIARLAAAQAALKVRKKK